MKQTPGPPPPLSDRKPRYAAAALFAMLAIGAATLLLNETPDPPLDERPARSSAITVSPARVASTARRRSFEPAPPWSRRPKRERVSAVTGGSTAPILATPTPELDALAMPSIAPGL